MTASLGMLLFGIGMITLGALLPDLKLKHSLDAIEAGTLFSILPAGILAGSLLFGPLSDRHGYRLVLSLSALLMFAGFEGLAWAQPVWVLALSVFLFGIGGGAINGTTNAVVADISATGKGANLSLLGVFYGIGALGMPLLLGLLKEHTTFETIVTGTGVLCLLSAILFMIVRYPAAKQSRGISLKQIRALLSDITLLIIAFFLFFQSAFEGLMNNWSTTYLTEHDGLSYEAALIGLSLLVVGMTLMRLLIGSLFRDMEEKKLLNISFIIILSSLILLRLSGSALQAASALFLTEAGLAAGFPTMLGLVGQRYPSLSGTVFSFVLVIALTGNMIINWLMGVTAERWGIGYLTTFTFTALLLMTLLAAIIFGRLKNQI